MSNSLGRRSSPICELGLDLKHPRLGFSTPPARFTDQSQIAFGGLRLPDFPNDGKSIGKGIAGCDFISGDDGEFEQGRVVPVIRFARGDATFYRISDDGYEFVFARVGWLAQRHERDRVNTGISIP